MPILVDGNNLLYRLPRGMRSRAAVRRMVLDLVRHESTRVLVVFDGPPPAGSPERESLGRVSVLYAGPRSADDVIMARLGQAPRPREWVVVTGDRGLASRARARGATVRGVAEWQAKLEAAARARDDDRSPAGGMSPAEVQQWEAYFASGRPAEPSADREREDRPAVVPRRRRRRR
jgi:hypothetical protein